MQGSSRLLGALLIGAPAPLAAQYFGRNKVQYEKFDFRIMRTSHFDLYFYPAESLVVHDAGRLAERWYTRHSDSFRHTFDRKSVVFYADHPDFQQTNVVGEAIEEGTGGITEGLRTRVVMPFTGIYADNDHVLGHELVHVFQYSVAENGPGGLARLNALPLWLIEGMAEYFSLGRDDPLTAMWLRDAAERDNLPTIKQLTNDARFFPYRYGQALWAYVGGRWGDRAVVDVYRTSLRIGFEEGIRRVLGISTDSLSKDWISATRRAYLPVLEGRTRPNGAGEAILQTGRKTGDMNLAPTVSPDGKLVAFFARRSLFEIELFVADAQTGRVIKKLAGPTSDSHFDAISFISIVGRLVSRQREVRLRRAGRGQPRDRHPRRELGEHRAAHPRAGRRLGVAHRVVAERADDRVQRHGRRHQRSVPARSRGGHGAAADERPQRRHAARVVAGRQDARLLDRSRHDDGLQEDGLLAAAAGDDRRGDRPDQRVQPLPARASTSIRSTRPTGRASSSSAIRTASATSTASQLASGDGDARDAALDGRQRHHGHLAGAHRRAVHRTDALLRLPGSGLRRVRARLDRAPAASRSCSA